MRTTTRQSKRPILKGVMIITVVALLCSSGTWIFAGRLVFNPDEIAAAETRMWQAYYDLDLPRLHGELVALLRSQFGLSAEDAESISRNLGAAAMKFERSRGKYEQVVLPDLVVAYRKLRTVLKRSFDPQEAARAELSWWIARRTPGRDSPQQVGRRIAELYAIIYGGERPGFLEAGVLRAEAAGLRDRGGVDCDWPEVERLLRRSYRALAGAVQ